MTINTDGLLVVDKPEGISSRDAVDRALCWFPRKTRMGHTGTLDPLASGVLVLCLGTATRLVEYVQDMSKVYLSTFLLGSVSDCDDGEGVITRTLGAADPGREAVERALSAFVGEVMQVPPSFSAARVEGKRAYNLARRGRDVEIPARPVKIYSIHVVRYDYPELEVEVHCGKGTYIRSLARDVGAALGVGGYVYKLRRTRVGPFDAAQALDMDATNDQARAAVLPSGLALAELPRLVLSPADADHLRNGRKIPVPEALRGTAGEVGAFDEAGGVVAVARIDAETGLLRPAKVFGRGDEG